MITRQSTFLTGWLLLTVLGVIIPPASSAQQSEIAIKIDGATRYQTMDGLGVNINPAWWEDGRYQDAKVIQPAIDLLVDSLGATIFRVVIEEIDWEEVNDDNDPDNFNWTYFNSVFSNARFRGVWNTLRYLNQKGITKGLIISFMGAPPASLPLEAPDPKKSWMGGVNHTIDSTMEDELVESIAALLYYMRYTAGIQFSLVSPMNETDVIAGSKSLSHTDGVVEGPNIPDAIQFVRVVRKLAGKLDAIGMSDLRFVAPDAASDHLFSACLDEMVKDSSLMYRLAYWGVHQYGNDAGKFIPSTRSWIPRKQFYEHAQIMKFIKPGSERISVTGQDSSIIVYAYQNPDGNIIIVGRNNLNRIINITGTLENLPAMKSMKLLYTSPTDNLTEGEDTYLSGKDLRVPVPPESVFTIKVIAESSSSFINKDRPEPPGWYAGDIHIHRNCGEVTSIIAENELTAMMEPNDLAVISILADMGNGEVKESRTDLPKVSGSDADYSTQGRIVHWDAEWHFDLAGVAFENKALGGHLILLGLKEAHQIWDESLYKILDWGKSKNAIAGFCHMQYLNDKIQNDLNCCIPIDYPVEAALGTIDFLSEDVWLNDAAVNGYYKILNCGFRLGWAAGTDFPCNDSRPFGSLLTYVQVKDPPLTYRKWIEGIKNGRTVVTTNGHAEFLDLKINGTAGPGDEIKFKGNRTVNIDVTWTTTKVLTGRIELVCNGKVVAIQEGTAKPGGPVHMKTTLALNASSWICARRMNETGHQSHTAPVYISVRNAPVRASVEDALYFEHWIDKILANIRQGGPWNQYFTHDLDKVQKRYQKARDVYKEIALQASVKK